MKKRVCMDNGYFPELFRKLQSEGYIKEADVLKTSDGFFLVHKSLAQIIAERNILDFPGSKGRRLQCAKFYDDWYLYAVAGKADDVYGLLKMREQEHDTQEGDADGDIPGVTISFVPFAMDILFDCLTDPADENRMRLDHEINRVVVRRGQCHHKALKRYFIDPGAQGAYLVSGVYSRHIAAFAEEGSLDVPEHYQKIVKQYRSGHYSAKEARLPCFIESLNQKAGYVVCDHDKIYIKDPMEPTIYESTAILATHTGNTSQHSFAAEVEFHARFLTPAAKIKIPFAGRSVYDSSIRADMSVGDAELQGPTPYYQSSSTIVKRQRALHHEQQKDEIASMTKNKHQRNSK